MGRKSRLDAIGRKLKVGTKGGSSSGKRSMKEIAKLGDLGDLGKHMKPRAPVARSAEGGAWGHPRDYKSIRQTLQGELQTDFDFDKHGGHGKDKTGEIMIKHLAQLADRSSFSISRADRESMFQEIVDNLLGLGPLEHIVNDPKITDIMINGPFKTFIEKNGLITEVKCEFDDDDHLLLIVRRIIAAVGRKVDEQNPLVDARMADGSRFNAIIRPCALDGCAVSIRRFGVPITPDQLVEWNAMPKQQMEFLACCVKAKMNIVISGGTGSGKTTLLNCLSGFVPEGERLVTIEDSAELQLQQDHVVRLEGRPPNGEGVGEVTLGELLTHSLRMRADRIILGEIRGKEAIDMLQAMNSGNPGSMATVHSNSPSDAISRFETLVGIAMPNMSDKFIRTIIASSLDVIVQLNRLTDGSRRCTHIAEVQGMEGPYVQVQNIFKFEQDDVIDGTIYGTYAPTGFQPRLLSKLRKLGIEVDPDWFKFQMFVAGTKRYATLEERDASKPENRKG